MFHVLGIGRSGLHANQFKMDALADEVANINTDGYKTKKVDFQELIVNADTSVGSKAGVSRTDFSQGMLKETGKTWDLALEGEGFFGVADGEGNLLLTRNGAFTMTDGVLTNEKGYRVLTEYYQNDPQVLASAATMSEDGTITSEDGIALGRIHILMPDNPQELVHLGEGNFLPGPGMELQSSLEGAEDLGKIRTGFLEGSNGNLLNGLTEMIVTQRAYSLNGEAVRSTDELMKLINDMKR